MDSLVNAQFSFIVITDIAWVFQNMSSTVLENAWKATVLAAWSGTTARFLLSTVLEVVVLSQNEPHDVTPQQRKVVLIRPVQRSMPGRKTSITCSGDSETRRKSLRPTSAMARKSHSQTRQRRNNAGQQARARAKHPYSSREPNCG